MRTGGGDNSITFIAQSVSIGTNGSATSNGEMVLMWAYSGGAVVVALEVLVKILSTQFLLGDEITATGGTGGTVSRQMVEMVVMEEFVIDYGIFHFWEHKTIPFASPSQLLPISRSAANSINRHSPRDNI